MSVPPPRAVEILENYAHRMPMRAEQIRAVAATLTTMRQAMGDTAASHPQYQSLLRLLRAHACPLPQTDVSFAQVQAVRLQILAVRLTAEGKPFPHQLAAAIRQGLVSGFDSTTGKMVQDDAEQPQALPWAQRTLPVQAVGRATVVGRDILVGERERALAYRMRVTDGDVTKLLEAEGEAMGREGDSFDPHTAALLETRKRHVALLGLQRQMRATVMHEFGMAEAEGRVGSKSRQRLPKQMQKEHEKMERARVRREEGEEREARKRKQSWMNALSDHTDRFRRYHRDVVRRGVRAVVKSMSKYHDEMSRNANRAERDAEKARIQKLRDDDEEGYLELVRETKNTRLLELLNQTDTYLKELGAIVKDERAKTGEVEYGADVAEDSQQPAKHRYYDIAHAIKEEITEQSSLMVGGKLKEYQLHGVQWMVSLYNNRLNGILADEMGLGKTIQTLGLIAYLMEMKENAGPYLVIVPLSTMSNWEMEFARWAPAIRVVVFKGDSKARRRLYETVIEKNQFNVCLATYEYVVRGKNYLKRIHWQHIIIDEGHRIKNHESKLSIVLHKDYTSRSRLLLTGTPLQNSLTELWALLNFLLPKVFKSAESFESWFAAPFAQMGVGNVPATEESAQLTEEESLLIIRRLHQVLRPFLLRRLKADVLRMGEQLPDKKEHIIICDMSAWQKAMYVKIVKSERVLFTDRHGRDRYDKLSNPAMQLKKCVNHPYLFYPAHSSMVVDGPNLWRCAGKFDMLDACITKFLRGGHRMLIFNQMTKVVDLQARLLNFRKIPFFRLDGTTASDDRKQMVSDFNREDSDVNVFLLTTRAGGLGVNLQTADTVIIFDSDWNPSMDQQAQDRAHRIGQRREVLILRMITAKSVEEDVIERASFKRGLEQKIIRAGMFDESSKDSERQAMLRELLRVEEAASDNEDGEGDADGLPTDEELNRLLARSEEEFTLFSEIDTERDKERGDRSNLFVENEIPDFAVRIPKALLAKAKAEEKGGGGVGEGGELLDLHTKPKRRSVTKNVSYGLDSLSERQYLKMMENAEEGKFASVSDGVRAVQSKKRGRGRPRKHPVVEVEEDDSDDEEDDSDEEEFEGSDASESDDDDDVSIPEPVKRGRGRPPSRAPGKSVRPAANPRPVRPQPVLSRQVRRRRVDETDSSDDANGSGSGSDSAEDILLESIRNGLPPVDRLPTLPTAGAGRKPQPAFSSPSKIPSPEFFAANRVPGPVFTAASERHPSNGTSPGGRTGLPGSRSGTLGEGNKLHPGLSSPAPLPFFRSTAEKHISSLPSLGNAAFPTLSLNSNSLPSLPPLAGKPRSAAATPPGQRLPASLIPGSKPLPSLPSLSAPRNSPGPYFSNLGRKSGPLGGPGSSPPTAIPTLSTLGALPGLASLPLRSEVPHSSMSPLGKLSNSIPRKASVPDIFIRGSKREREPTPLRPPLRSKVPRVGKSLSLPEGTTGTADGIGANDGGDTEDSDDDDLADEGEGSEDGEIIESD